MFVMAYLVCFSYQKKMEEVRKTRQKFKALQIFNLAKNYLRPIKRQSEDSGLCLDASSLVVPVSDFLNQ